MLIVQIRKRWLRRTVMVATIPAFALYYLYQSACNWGRDFAGCWALEYPTETQETPVL